MTKDPLGMTEGVLENKRTFWALGALMLVLFSVTNLPWELDGYDQAKQAWTSYEMVTEGHWFYQRTSDDQGLATKPPLTGWMAASTPAPIARCCSAALLRRESETGRYGRRLGVRGRSSTSR